jgi:phosphate starvation-inducible protein PhoH
MIPAKRLQEFMSEGTIQIAPLAYMRGRTLDRACVILDEAQNTNLGQLKMFLTRMGCDAKFIVTGDASQIDLPNKKDSGLLRGIEYLKLIGHCIFRTHAAVIVICRSQYRSYDLTFFRVIYGFDSFFHFFRTYIVDAYIKV